MAEVTRTTVVAVVKESVEGTPEKPASGANFFPVRSGFSMDPNINTLTNEELSSSLGPRQPILGLESPQAKMPLYLKPSGLEGTEPSYGPMLECTFGAKQANSTQRVTTTGSTAGSSSAAAVIHAAAGGTDFQRGSAVLIKDPTNGYSVRAVKSVSTNNLTLGFNLAAAPATGVGLGKCVLYKPATTIPSLTAWLYRSNGAATEAVAGAKGTDLSVSITAGEFIQAEFTLSGTAHLLDPIEITATDIKFDFTDGVGAKVATVSAEMWSYPDKLAAALQSSMNAQGSADTFTVEFISRGVNAGKFRIATSGSTLSLNWNTGPNTANTIGDKIGFVIASDDTGATSYVSDNAQTWAAPFTPDYDDLGPLVAKANEIMIGDFDETDCIHSREVKLTLTNAQQDVNAVCAESGKSETIIKSRVSTIDVVAYLKKNQVDFYRRFKEGETTSFQYAYGIKAGDNWVPGKVGYIYSPSATISSINIDDADDLAILNMTLSPFVDDSSNDEIYMGFL